tara:strand:+ start:1179 stop:1811 length:633 start_codon:yes stop_codon:yes gene_type:complete
MKKNNNISRRDFLLINYIKEVITRRDVLKGMFGGLAATQIPDIAMARDEIDNEILIDFIKQCFKHLKKYQSSRKLEYILLKTILKNSIFSSPSNEDYIRIRRVTKDEKNVFGRDFYTERDRLEKKLKKIGAIGEEDDLDFGTGPEIHPFILNVSISPKLFISRFIDCITSYLRSRNDISDNRKFYNVAFQDEDFNSSDMFFNLYTKGVNN